MCTATCRSGLTFGYAKTKAKFRWRKYAFSRCLYSLCYRIFTLILIFVFALRFEELCCCFLFSLSNGMTFIDNLYMYHVVGTHSGYRGLSLISWLLRTTIRLIYPTQIRCLIKIQRTHKLQTMNQNPILLKLGHWLVMENLNRTKPRDITT